MFNKKVRLHVLRYLSGVPLEEGPDRIRLTVDGLPIALGHLKHFIRKGDIKDLR
jgi:hypothetical protein